MTGLRWRIGVVALALCSCATTSTTDGVERDVRPAEDTPPAFTSEDGSALGEECRNVMIDQRDMVRLRLIRSGATAGTGHGDYEVPTGKYGVKDREYLRINCVTGQTLGIVAAG